MGYPQLHTHTLKCTNSYQCIHIKPHNIRYAYAMPNMGFQRITMIRLLKTTPWIQSPSHQISRSSSLTTKIITSQASECGTPHALISLIPRQCHELTTMYSSNTEILFNECIHHHHQEWNKNETVIRKDKTKVRSTPDHAINIQGHGNEGWCRGK